MSQIRNANRPFVGYSNVSFSGWSCGKTGERRLMTRSGLCRSLF